MKEILIIGRSSGKTCNSEIMEELIQKCGFSIEEQEAACDLLSSSFQAAVESMKQISELASKIQFDNLNEKRIDYKQSVNPYERKYKNNRNRYKR